MPGVNTWRDALLTYLIQSSQALKTSKTNLVHINGKYFGPFPTVHMTQKRARCLPAAHLCLSGRQPHSCPGSQTAATAHPAKTAAASLSGCAPSRNPELSMWTCSRATQLLCCWSGLCRRMPADHRRGRPPHRRARLHARTAWQPPATGCSVLGALLMAALYKSRFYSI